MLKTPLWTGVLLCAMASCQAAESGFTPYLGAGLTFGGDKIGDTIENRDGDRNALHGGSLLDVRAGLEYQPPESPLSVQMSAGYHIDSALATRHSSANFGRVPLELLVHWRALDAWRFGGGLRQAFNARTTSSGRGADYVEAQRYDADLGYVLEAERFFGPRFGLKIRGVSERYSPQKTGQDQVDGSHLGVIATYYFR
jgi:hypothetical protein